MLTLRAEVQKIIEKSKNAEMAAKYICIMLDDPLSLYGNGWFENDPEMDELIGNPSLEDNYLQLSAEVEKLLSDGD